MKKLHIYLLFLAAFIISSCQTQLPDPDTDAVFKSITKTYELKNDGSVLYQYQHQLKYLTHVAFNRFYGESFIVYNPEKQELKVNKSLTTQKDGTKISSPENAYNKVLPRFADGAPAYNHLREMVVTHTGLELGCLVDFDYELKSKKGYIPFLNENLLLAENSPVQKMKIVVKVPEGQALHYKLLNANAEPKINTKNGQTTYTWNFEQLKPESFDRDQPHYNQSLPRLLFSTATVKEALHLFAMDNKISEPIIAKTDEKVKNAKSDFEKLFALQNLVCNDMNGFHIPIEHTGYRVRNFDNIWKSNGATDMEKTLFLSALLNHYQIKAKPVLACPKTEFDENMGLIKNVGHAYIAAQIGDETLIISATHSSAKNNLAYALNNQSLVDFDGNTINLDTEKYDKTNMLSVKGELALSYKGDISGSAQLYLTGNINPYFDFIKDEKNAKSIAGKALDGMKVKQAKLNSWNDEASEISFDFEKKEATKKQEAYNFLNLAKSSLGFSAHHLSTLTEKRTSPIESGGPIEEVYDFKMQIPSGYVMVIGDVDTTLTNAVGEVSIKFKHTLSGLEIYKKLVLNNKEVAVDAYSNFRDLYLLWNHKNYNEIVLKETHK